MKTYLTYGGALAIGSALLLFALYFLGFHSAAAQLSASQIISTVVNLILWVTCLVLGTRARLAEVPVTEEFGYGRALGSCVMILLFAGLFGMVTTYLYFAVVNPGFADLIIQTQLDAMEAKGLSGAQLEQAENGIRMVMTPVGMTIYGFIGTMTVGTLVALVTAAFLRRAAVADPDLTNTPPPLA